MYSCKRALNDDKEKALRPLCKMKGGSKGFLKTSHCVTSAFSPAPVEQVWTFIKTDCSKELLKRMEQAK